MDALLLPAEVFINTRWQMRDVVDGTSSTLLLGERDAHMPGIPARTAANPAIYQLLWSRNKGGIIGDRFMLVFTGIGANDSWNSVAGRFSLARTKHEIKHER